MKKEITIDGRTLALSANAATPIRYKMTFNQDLIIQLGSVKDDRSIFTETLSQMAYIMNKQAEGDLSDLSFENYLMWLEDFEDPNTFVNCSDAIVNFYLSNVKTGSKVKNPKGPRTGK